jgi:hypothetical protein
MSRLPKVAIQKPTVYAKEESKLNLIFNILGSIYASFLFPLSFTCYWTLLFCARRKTHPDFGNSAEEFHPHKTLSTPMKLLSSLSSLIWCHISIINAHKTLMKPH